MVSTIDGSDSTEAALLVEALDRLLHQHCAPDVVAAIETGAPASAAALWQAVQGAGFTDLMLPEADGGAGLRGTAVFEVLRLIGRHTVPLPLGQTIVARALLPQALWPGGPVALATALRTGADGGLVCPHVPQGRWAQWVLAVEGADAWWLDCAHAQASAAQVPRDLTATLRWAPGHGGQRLAGAGPAVAAAAAAVQAALLAGAMAAALDLTLAHCAQRRQFGRALGEFQAVQQQVSVMAEQVVAASLAAEAAWAGDHATPGWLGAALAKARASEAALAVASTAHALHGASGIAEAGGLARFSRALHAGRLAHGAEDVWHRAIGQALLASGQTLVDFLRVA